MLATTPGAAAASAAGRVAVYLAEGGSLRVNGPETRGASDLEVAQWTPDTRAPRAADVEWIPARYAREDLQPKDIRSAHLEPGSTLALGAATLTVAALEGQAVDHPAWVRFEIAPR